LWITWSKQFTEWLLERREITSGRRELGQVNSSPLQIEMSENDLEFVYITRFGLIFDFVILNIKKLKYFLNLMSIVGPFLGFLQPIDRFQGLRYLQQTLRA